MTTGKAFGVLLEVVDALGVEERAAPLDAVHDVALLEQEFGQIGPILAGDPGDERDLGLGFGHGGVGGVWGRGDCKGLGAGQSQEG